MTPSSGLVSEITLVRPAACSANTVARSARVPTIDPITEVPLSTARCAGLGRRRAALLAGGAAAVFGGWFTASAAIAGHGWYHARLGHGVPWLPVAVVGFLGLLLALRRIPVVTRALTAPGVVPLLLALHITYVSALRTAPRTPMPATAPLTASI